jgi:hypothetical protein
MEDSISSKRQQQQRQQHHVIFRNTQHDDDSNGQQQRAAYQRSEIRLVANYSTETYTYYYSNRHPPSNSREENEQQQPQKPLHIQMESATTTQGSNLTSSEGHDLTGIMIWPATHLLCQYLCFDNSPSTTSTTNKQYATTNHKNDKQAPPPPPPLCIGKTVVELGCGCGLLGVTALQFVFQKEQHRQQQLQQQQHDDDDNNGLLWVSTDLDEHALSLCRRNYALNGIKVRDKRNNNNSTATAATTTNSSSRCHVQQLRWGDPEAIQATLSILEKHHHRQQRQHEKSQSSSSMESATSTWPLRFDAVVGADIVYPSTSLDILKHLFGTVDQLLSLEGSFWLSFATRDGHRTPVKLIQAASQAGFTISCVHMNDEQNTILRRLPPLLDSKILVLQRNAHARELNASLGKEACTVFPGLQRAIDALDRQSSSDEEWEPPFFNEEDDDYE